MDQSEQQQRSHAGRGLKFLIHRHYVRSALVVIFAIDLVLVLLYFGINTYMSNVHQRTLMQDATLNLLDITMREAGLIDSQLDEVRRQALVLQDSHQQFFAAPSPASLPQGEPQFARHANGALYKRHDNGGASLYYSAQAWSPQQLQLARDSEMLDPMLKAMVQLNPLITQAYLNTADGMNRLYPFMPDAPGQYGPTLDMQAYNFYYLADAGHNPSRGPVWTGAYLDPAGQGWMLSCIVPVYHNDTLVGVSGLDATIRNFVDHVLDLQLPWQGHAFLVDDNGMILAMPPAIEQLLGLHELKEHVYESNVADTVLRPEEYNLLLHPDASLRQQFTDFLSASSQVRELDIDGHDYLMVRDRVNATGWTLITLVDQDVLFHSIYLLERTTARIGILALLVMLAFYILFFAFLNRSALRLAERIASPLRRLAERTRNLGQQLQPGLPLPSAGIDEIDSLNQTFNQMASQLDERTRKLVESQTRILMAEEQARILAENALTDHLTGLANRARLEEVLSHEIERASHTQRPLAVVMIDVDHFKQVNDEHGHEAGDRVMVELARLFRINLRPTDCIGRWGGEEFLLICPNTTQQEARQLAERLRSMVASHLFEGIGHKTISLGITRFQPGREAQELLRRADLAMYRAKQEGRNRVEQDHPE